MIKIKPYLLTSTFILLLFSTYYNVGKYTVMMILCCGICHCLFCSEGIIFHRKTEVKIYALFCMYYIVVSFVGILLTNVKTIKLMENICMYIGFPLYVNFCLPRKKKSLYKSMIVFRNFIIISALYGLIEQLIKYNPLSRYISNKAVSWLLLFEQSENFQCSSLYLHYNYYGCILVFAYILLSYFPIKNRLLNIVAKLLLLEQLLFCQSRMSWITFFVVFFIKTIISHKITQKSIQNIIICIFVVAFFLLFFPSALARITNLVYVRFLGIFMHGMNDGSLGQRLGTLFNWLDYVKNNTAIALIGSGYQSINKVYLPEYSYFKGYSTADCMITTYLVETGIVGMFLICFFLAKKMLKKHKNEDCSFYFIMLFLMEGLTLDLVSNYYIFFIIVCSFFVGKTFQR